MKWSGGDCSRQQVRRKARSVKLFLVLGLTWRDVACNVLCCRFGSRIGELSFVAMNAACWLSAVNCSSLRQRASVVNVSVRRRLSSLMISIIISYISRSTSTSSSTWSSLQQAACHSLYVHRRRHGKLQLAACLTVYSQLLQHRQLISCTQLAYLS